MRRDGRGRLCVAALAAALASFGCGESARHASPGGGPAPASRGRDGQLLLVDEFRRPFGIVPVLVDGAVVYTGEDGFAPLPEVGASYDVAFADQGRAYVFQGLSSRAPVIQIPSRAHRGAVFETDLEIQKPTAPDDTSLRFMAGIEELTEASPLLGYSNDDSDLEARIIWPDINPATLSVAALLVQIDPLTQEPLSYLGYSAEEWPEVPAKLKWAPSFDAPLDSATIHVDLKLPPGGSSPVYQVTASDGAGRSGLVGFSLGDPSAESGGVASADVLVPDLPDTTFALSAQTVMSGGSFIAYSSDELHAGDTVELDSQANPVLLSPADGASVDSATDFTWTPGGGTVHRFFAATVDDGESFDVQVTSTGPSARPPDLSALGVPFPYGRSLGRIAGDFAGVSLDAYAAGAPYSGLGFSQARSVTVAPAP